MARPDRPARASDAPPLRSSGDRAGIRQSRPGKPRPCTAAESRIPRPRMRIGIGRSRARGVCGREKRPKMIPTWPLADQSLHGVRACWAGAANEAPAPALQRGLALRGLLECRRLAFTSRRPDRRRPERPDPQSSSADQFRTSLSVPGPPRPGASDSDPHERRRDHARPPAHSSSVAESRRPAVAAGAFRSRAGRPCGCRAPLPEQSRSRRPAERALPGGLGPGASPTGSRLSCLTAAPHAA